MKPPAFQFYAADFLVGTATMTAEEVGAYIRLLCYQWDTGFVPDDDATICRLGGCQASAVAKLRQKFRVDPDGLRNVRLETEREKQRAYRNKQAVNGAKRWVGDAKPQGLAKPTHEPDACSPSPSPSPSSRIPLAKPSAPRAQDEVFNALCRIEGSDPAKIGSGGSRIGKCLKLIREATPEVTPAEIQRRAANYKRHFKDATISADALAKWWTRCDNGLLPGIEEPLPASNLR